VIDSLDAEASPLAQLAGDAGTGPVVASYRGGYRLNYTRRVVEKGRPISYLALAVGTPVVSSSGTEFGKVHHVLQVPDLDLSDGISVKTPHGLRFVDRDQITEMTSTAV
jgi:hypothetical protein